MNSFKTKRHTSRGAAIMIFMLLFLIASLILVGGIGRGVYQDIIRYRSLESGKQSFYGAEAILEDSVYRFRNGMAFTGPVALMLGDTSVTATSTVIIDYFLLTAEGETNSAYRKSEVELDIGNGASFNFGLQSGNGGITMSNSSSVRGNVFSNGSVVGQGTATIYGDVISAGPAGLIEAIYATGTAWAHSLDSATIDGDAYYFATATRVATIVNGTSYPGSPDQATSSFPISDELIQEWKGWITASGTVISATSTECTSGGGTYVIDTDTSLGGVKIDCNVELRKQGAGTTLTIDGPIWIAGNFTLNAGPTVQVAAGVGERSVQIIVDNEANRTTSSKIAVNNATEFYGSGDPKSYVLLLSMNDDAENGGGEIAIDLNNSLIGDVLVYASHGLVDLGNNITLKEVTAYQIEVNNGADVIYESGLISTLFTGGPGGSFIIEDWQEIE